MGKRVVSLPVASVMGRCSHIPEGYASNRGCGGHMVQQLGSVLFLRKHGSGVCHKQGLSQGPPAESPAAPPLLFHGSAWGHNSCPARPWGRKHTSRRPLSEQTATVSFSISPGSSAARSSPTPTARAGARTGAPVDITSVDRAVQRYLEKCVAPSTRVSYASAHRRYISFCANLPGSQPLLA